MEPAIKNNDYASIISLKKVTESFFSNNSPDHTRYLFWKLLQCYVLKDCTTKVDVPEKEVALFYDQLMDLVAAAYIVHQANRASPSVKEGGENA